MTMNIHFHFVTSRNVHFVHEIHFVTHEMHFVHEIHFVTYEMYFVSHEMHFVDEIHFVNHEMHFVNHEMYFVDEMYFVSHEMYRLQRACHKYNRWLPKRHFRHACQPFKCTPTPLPTGPQFEQTVSGLAVLNSKL